MYFGALLGAYMFIIVTFFSWVYPFFGYKMFFVFSSFLKMFIFEREREREKVSMGEGQTGI